MTTGDQLVEKGADRLQQLSEMAARAKGEAPMDQPPGSAPRAPTGPQLGSRPQPKQGDGPNPFLIVGIAFAAGIVLAKWIDWRGHAHPRR